jgi:hypothetical protein
MSPAWSARLTAAAEPAKTPFSGTITAAPKPSLRRPSAVDSGTPSPSSTERQGMTPAFQCAPGRLWSGLGASTSTHGSTNAA